jgi:beta-galactosidase
MAFKGILRATFLGLLFLADDVSALATGIASRQAAPAGNRERTNLNAGWTFNRWEEAPDGLSYEQMKPWILPSANNFITDESA